MPYIFEGKLRGYLCDDCIEPLSGVLVRLYRAVDQRQPLTHAAAAREEGEKPELLSEEQVKEKAPLLLGEGRADEEGRFRVEIGDASRYEGGLVEVDVRVERLPGQPDDGRERPPAQFTAAVVNPDWKRGQLGASARWSLDLSRWIWCWIRGRFDAWVICGRLVTCKDGIPIEGAVVRAYDADWLQDDALGSDTTDAGGHFRIHYTSAQFRKTPFSPWINAELTEGPDLYFKAWYDGALVLAETQSDGRARGRENVRHCFCVRLCTDKVKVLKADLTGPNGCVPGDSGVIPGKVVAPVTGTAAGTIFGHYELEVLWDGTDTMAGVTIYPDAGGNPDPAATQGSHAVVNGTLGWIDLRKLAQEAGSRLVESTAFTIRLRVFGGGQTKTDVTAFQISVGNVYISGVGGAGVASTVPVDEPLMSGGAVASVGGSASVVGAADVFGCEGQKISEYRVWVREDSGFALPQPNDGDAFGGAGWTKITDIAYTTDEQRSSNRLDGMPNPDLLTRSGWGTRTVCFTIFGTDVCLTFPHLVESSWGTLGAVPPSGKYSVLLEVVDTGGNTYYDIQRVWVDNHPIEVSLTGVAGLMPCMDLFTQDPSGTFRTVNVEGTAWDALIVPADPSVPSDNFGSYTVRFQKQGAASWVTLQVPGSAADPAVGGGPTSTEPVPARPAPVGVGVLALWPMDSVDAASNPYGLPAEQLLAPGESCAYLVRLDASDTTLVNNGSTTHHGEDFFPVKVINGAPA